MADSVKRVAYFKMMVPNRAGQGARALAVLQQAAEKRRELGRVSRTGAV